MPDSASLESRGLNMDKQPPLRVMMLGLRGFPDVQGGIEKHAENLCPLLVSLGCEVEVIVRSPYQPVEAGAVWNGVKFRRIWAPHSKGLETFVHTFLGVLYAACRRPDILHIQAIGPALMTPLASLLGLRVVVTHHGPDYDRQKWGLVARLVLQLGERFGMRFSDRRIVISNVIRQLVHEKHGTHCALIPNGVVLPEMPGTTAALDELGVEPGRYVLMVGRLVQEKRQLDLIAAFAKAAVPGWKLVLVGSSDHPDAYTMQVQDAAEQTPGVVMAGFRKGRELQEFYAHAGLFVLPSSHEGLPIALLEALSYGLPVAVSDIPANLEVGLTAECYFPVGDVDALAGRIVRQSRQAVDAVERTALREDVGRKYDWRRIAEQTLDVYRSMIPVRQQAVVHAGRRLSMRTNRSRILKGGRLG